MELCCPDGLQSDTRQPILVSPKDGKVPLEPKSLARLTLDADTKAWKDVESNMALLGLTYS